MIGDAQWLIDTEQKYGGFVSGIPRRVWSPHETQPDPEFTVFMLGGDRMSPEHHNYAPAYARSLSFLVQHRLERLLILEVGILRGTGLAVWSDLFPNATIIGLDIDLGFFETNVDNLKSLGAFANTEPELYQFDQLVDVEQQCAVMDMLLAGRSLDLVIDDGCHRDNAILTTFQAVAPHFREHTVYFAEDNWNVAGRISNLAEPRETVANGPLTTVRKRCACW